MTITMGYTDRDTPLTAPLNTHSVAKCLGENTLDIGALCTSPLINKWSFHKPVAGLDKPEVTDEDICSVDSGFYALADHVATTLRELAERYDNGGVDWEYDNSYLEWYRLTDFIGYLHKAKDCSPTNITFLRPPGEDDGYGNRKPTLCDMKVSWNADIEVYLPRFQTIKSFSYLSGVCDANLCMLVWVKRPDDFTYNPYIYVYGNYGSTDVFVQNLSIEQALWLINGNPIDESEVLIKAMPVLMNNSTHSAGGHPPFNRLYDNSDLNSGDDKGLLLAPYKFLALGGKPIEGSFKPIIYEVCENLQVVFRHSEGSNVQLEVNQEYSYITWNGQLEVTNNTDYLVGITVGLTGQQYIGDISATGDEWATLSLIPTEEVDINKGITRIFGNKDTELKEWRGKIGLTLAITVTLDIPDPTTDSSNSAIDTDTGAKPYIYSKTLTIPIYVPSGISDELEVPIDMTQKQT